MWPLRNLPSGGRTGDVEGAVAELESARANGLEEEDETMEMVDMLEFVESVLEWRELRRNGIDGRRKVGNIDGWVCGSEGFRRRDIMV